VGDLGVNATTGDRLAVRVSRAIAGVRADFTLAAIETLLIVLAYSAAMSLRFLDAGNPPDEWWIRLLAALPIVVIVHIGMNIVFGNYGHVWKYASVEEAMRLVGAAMSAGFVLLSLLFIVERTVYSGGHRPLPVSVLVLGALLTLGGMGALRFWSRMFSYRRMMGETEGERTLVVGTGEAAAHLARHRSAHPEAINIVGFIDPDPNGAGDRSRRLAGLPVLGGLGEVPMLVEGFGIEQIIIASEGADELARQLVDSCMGIPVRLRIMPEIDAVLRADAGTVDVRDLELTDLLPRATVHTDLRAVSTLLAGRRVLVTGAGGSIGSEIVRQILEFGPRLVVALDHDETHLHDANARWVVPEHVECRLELADIRDEARIRDVFGRHRPEVVFHAAAHKHVPILEEVPDEAAKTNVLGTAILVQAAKDFDVANFVLISTDKAVDPSSVMGATKRMAEMLIQAQPGDGPPVFCAVRFGNVLGSRGSVVPTFTRQIKEGGPVTVSHPEMERYFMTVDEAVQLVLQAAALSHGGEVFVLDMGEPVKILDLAHRLIRLAGLVPEKDISVVITGVRPGERLTEYLAREPLQPTDHEKIMMATPTHPGPATMFDAVEQVRALAANRQNEELVELLMRMARARWPEAEVVDLRPVVGKAVDSANEAGA